MAKVTIDVRYYQVRDWEETVTGNWVPCANLININEYTPWGRSYGGTTKNIGRAMKK